MTMTNPAPATAGIVTKKFDTPGYYDWTVPAGVHAVTLNVNGAQGGGDGEKPKDFVAYGHGGKGARVLATFAVEPGDLLSLEVGGRGTKSAGGYRAGWPGYGPERGLPGYGGGGASRVYLNDVEVVVAGGGGGAAARSGVGVSGVDGGDSGAPGGATGNSRDGAGGGAGDAGAAGAAGRGGIGESTPFGCHTSGDDGLPGTEWTGGRGGGTHNTIDWYGYAGGGGGGGYAGGGGGGSSVRCEDDLELAGGAGGGGSSYLSPSRLSGQLFEGARSGDGAIGIVVEDTTPPVAAPVLSPAPNAAGWNSTGVTVLWDWSDPDSDVDLSRCTTVSQVAQTGIAMLQASCVNGAGIYATVSQQVKVDLVYPKASARLGPAGVTWNWYDAQSGIDPATCPATTPWNVVATVTCYDKAGNHTTMVVPQHP